jgi:Na+/H+ antiporter NhaD/arsenite permease-like protein
VRAALAVVAANESRSAFLKVSSALDEHSKDLLLTRPILRCSQRLRITQLKGRPLVLFCFACLVICLFMHACSAVSPPFQLAICSLSHPSRALYLRVCSWSLFSALLLVCLLVRRRCARRVRLGRR